MNVTQIVFSPTGGTEKVTEILTDAWGFPTAKVDLADANLDFSQIRLGPEDVAVVSVPSFGGRVPAPAVQRISQIHAEGTPCVLVCVYGNRAYEDTLAELYDATEKSGFKIIAAISAVAEHSIMHQYATGRPDEQDREQIGVFAGRILERLQANPENLTPPDVPGNRPYKKTGGVSLVPKAGKSCNECGSCAAQCPTQAIRPDDLKHADSDRCIACMRCVIRCPQSARKVNGAMVSMAAMAIKAACAERKDPELFV